MTEFPSSFYHAIREASLDDLPFLERLEQACFSEGKQSSRSSLRHSLTSSSQMVLVIEGPAQSGPEKTVPMGAAVLFHYKRSLRVYSSAVDCRYRMKGLGEALMQHILRYAARHGYERISLEADVANPRLVAWYGRLGFEPMRTLPDYYGPREPALQMILMLSHRNGSGDHIVVVVDDLKLGENLGPDVNVCLAQNYLSDTHYANSNRFQVLNLCSSHKTHSMGYYVSLLATARNHLIVPSVMAMKDAAIPRVAQSILDEMREYLRTAIPGGDGDDFELTVILGKTEQSNQRELAKKLFSLFSIPFFTIALHYNGGWKLKKIKPLQLKAVLNSHPGLVREALAAYCLKRRNSRQRLKTYKYDLAILVDNEEKTPPSCPLALKKFQKAAEKVGFYVEFIGKEDQRRIGEFDALFIRETTAMENHTYAMSRHAYTEGLVVMDDPWSIMLCCNKVYLKERFARSGVCQPRGWLLTGKTCTREYLRSLPLPLVLKLPESSFSLGVYRVHSFEELETKLREMFRGTDLVIAQEFLQSDFDWRIGLLDNTPLFACKYYMASNHWQVCNWQTLRSEECYGRTETLPLNQVPNHILKAAANASSLIGNGLYGVDLKDINGKAYVIEVNDNPNIDAGSEDLLLGDELYERIMLSFFNRIEAERKQIRYLY